MSIPIGGLFISDGNFAIMDPQYGVGMTQIVANHAVRDAIATPYRKLGMIVICQSDALAGWQLNTATNTGTDADWSPFNSVSGRVIVRSRGRPAWARASSSRPISLHG